MSEQLNFKQVPFDTMYYNNLTKQGGQVLIECDPNRTVLKIIESCITKNNTVLSNAELAQWILRYYIARTKNHVGMVQVCAAYLKEFFTFGGYFERFMAKIQQHDYDKLQGNEHVASYAMNAPLYKYPNLYDISPEAKRIYEEIEWPMHHQLHDHHPEHYMRCVDEENNAWTITDDEMEEFFKNKGGHPAALMALGEMVADWMAVGVEMGNTAKSWWLKNKDTHWSYGPRYTQALEACLAFAPEQLFIDQIEPIPDPPKLKMNVMSEVSEEVISQDVADNIKDGLVYHASPVKVDVLSGKHTGKWSGERGNVFVTPVKGLAACFVVNKNDIVDKAEQQLGGRLIGLNFGYNVWNKPVDELRTLPREIVVTLNVRGLKPFTGESTGYLYTIDYTKYADKTHMFHKNPNSDVEFLIEGDVHYKSCEKITVKWKCVSSEDNIKRHGEAKVDSETSLEEYDEQKLRDSVYSEETAHLVIRKESDINSITDLKEFFSHCKYGIVDTSTGSLRGKTHTRTTEKDYYNHWKLLSPDETIKHKCGVCYDTVLVSKSVFDRLGIKYKLYFAYSNQDEKGNPTYTHTFAIYQDGGTWRWIEGSWGQFKKNDFSSSNSDELVSRIGKELANAHGVPQQILVLNSYPRPGVTMKEFHDDVMKGSKCCSVNPDRTSTSREDLTASTEGWFDPVHGWRMETGIELIHREPTRTELKRIWKNWQQMTPDQKRISDRKCRELFGCDNKTLYEYLLSQYKVESPDKGVVKYPPKSDESSSETLSMEAQYQHRAWRESDIKNIDDLNRFYAHVEYTVLDPKTGKPKYGYISPKDAYEQHRMLSVSDILKYEIGQCQDTTYLSSYFLTKWNIKHTCISVKSNDGVPTSDKNPGHITLVYMDKSNKWRWLEGTFQPYMNNNLVFDTEEKAIRTICKIFANTTVKPMKACRFEEFPPTGTPIDKEQAYYNTSDIVCVEVPDENIRPFSSAEAQQSSTPSKIAQKKKKILDFICKLCDTMEPSGLNSKRYRQIIGQMNDKEFDQFMNYMKEGKWQLHIVAPNMIVNLQNEDLLKACDLIGLDLFQRVWMYDKATGRKFLTDNKYMFVKLPIRRQQQFLDEKISVPDNDRTIDGLTGQVTGDSRSCSITNPEIQILAARGLNNTLQELVNIRGGNIHGYSEFRRMLEENGEGDLDMLDTGSRTRASVVGGKLLQSMMLDTNL